MPLHNLENSYPKIHKTAHIDSTAIVIGKVIIGKNVFVAPGAVIRADEPESLIIIKENCNIQDRVIIHSLKNSSVQIEANTSLAHGCIIHGPCKIGKNCFVGFGSVVFDAQIGDGVIINHLSCIEKVKISSDKFVPSGCLVNTQRIANALEYADKRLKIFARNVVKVNLELVKKYKKDLCSSFG